MKRLILCGSPRAQGRSSALCESLRKAYEESFPHDEVKVASLAHMHISPCTGCGACEHKVFGRDELYCVIADSMVRLRSLINSCDHFSLVAPVYFAGAPSQLKAFFDRLQPYYWTDFRAKPKRPSDLYVVGEGGDPHGFGPLVGSARSALAVAGFNVQTVHDWVGLIKADGTLLEQGDVLSGGRIYPAELYVCSMPDEGYSHS